MTDHDELNAAFADFRERKASEQRSAEERRASMKTWEKRASQILRSVVAPELQAAATRASGAGHSASVKEVPSIDGTRIKLSFSPVDPSSGKAGDVSTLEFEVEPHRESIAVTREIPIPLRTGRVTETVHHAEPEKMDAQWVRAAVSKFVRDVLSAS